MRHTLKTLAYGLLFLGLSSTLASCNSKQNEEKNTKQESITVKLSTVESKKINMIGSYNCHLQALSTSEIMAQSGGRLIKLYAQVGQRVQKGQQLARLDEAQYKQSEIRLNEARQNFQRLDELYKMGAIAKVQWEQAENNYKLAQTLSKNLKTNTYLCSPCNGIITQRFYDEGNMTSPKKPIFMVEDLSKIKAIINIPEQYFAQVKEGLEASVRIKVFPDETFTAKVFKIYPTINPRTHTLRVELLIDNKGYRLRSGFYADLYLNFGQNERLLVSDRAVHKVMGSGSRYVYVFKQGKAEFRKVELGEIHNGFYEVRSGLKLGERVVVSAVNNISDSCPIKEAKTQTEDK